MAVGRGPSVLAKRTAMEKVIPADNGELMMDDPEYLLSYGNVGDFGRFRCAEALACRRGDRVIVRSPRGQELGVVMRLASPEVGRLLPDQFVGQILRLATAGGFDLGERMQQRARRLFGA